MKGGLNETVINAVSVSSQEEQELSFHSSLTKAVHLLSEMANDEASQLEFEARTKTTRRAAIHLISSGRWVFNSESVAFT
jgi:hypothetical protein